MSGSLSGILGLVEISNGESGDMHTEADDTELHSTFCDRLSDWLRPKDEYSFVHKNCACVILKDIKSRGELELAGIKLSRIFDQPHYHLGRALPFHVSAGFTRLEGKNTDIALAMQQAGIALAEARQSTTLFKVYSPQKARNIKEESELLERMQEALERGEFHLYYQPKIHAGYRNLIGAEALIRWHTRGNEILTPDRFIDLAERNDIIGPLTWWVIKSAAFQLSQWPKELSIAVNISPALLLNDDILAVVSDALDIYNVKPSRMHLEVTEKIMMSEQERMLAQLARLKEIGVRISIDDFGTGFSSLAYFRDLPFDEIKIDKSFVQHMLDSEKDYAIVKAVIDLAHNFNLKVVAEGVHTIAIADRLAEMRCDFLQGFVFDQPLPVEEFESRYRI
ncbi:MAG: EAL domain-containing protein [Halioglobus sp.]|nr:EAL domain-containing protein [Halioglobus sp.]